MANNQNMGGQGRPPQHGGLPNPNQPVPKMQPSGNLQQNMAQSMQNGQRNINGGQRPPQGRPNGGQRPMNGQQGGQRPMPNGQRPAQGQQGGRPMQGQQRPMPNGQRLMQGGQMGQQGAQNYPMQRGNGGVPAQRGGQQPLAVQDENYDLLAPEEENLEETQEAKPKKGKGKFIAIGVVSAIALSLVGIKLYNKYKPKEPPPPEIIVVEYEDSGRLPLDNLVEVVRDYNPKNIEAQVENSWLAQEWDYANDNPVRENWINSVCSYLEFSYPMVQSQYDNGTLVTDDKGERVMEESPMTEGEPVIVTLVDYDALSATMLEEVETISQLYTASGYRPSDYTYTDEMTDLMLNYLLQKNNLPTKEVELVLPMELADVTLENNDGSTKTVKRYVITDDAELDKALFSSPELHNMFDTFGTIAMKHDNGTLLLPEDEIITAVTEAPEPEIEGEEDTSATDSTEEKAKTTKKETKKDDSKKSDEKKDDSSKKETKKGDSSVTESAVDDSAAEVEEETTTTTTTTARPSVIDPDGSLRYLVSEEGYVYESVITYTWIGAYFCANEYYGESNPEIQEGDGSFEFPAGIGTTVVTKVLGTDGVYHDVKVTLKGYWIGQDAIDYSIGFSEKNRGFDSGSVIKLICWEIQLENLEKAPFTAISELYLADKDANSSSRTGKMYGFYDTMEILPGQKVVINDWGTSTELDQKFVCWGKSFKRAYPAVYFKLLAGSGEEVPPYDANTTFINRNPNKDTESEAEEDYGMNSLPDNPAETTTVVTTAPPEAGQVVSD